MKYSAQQISYDFRTFQDIEKCIWNFENSYIQLDRGLLKILRFIEVEQNGQVGIQMDVDGDVYLKDYTDDTPGNLPTHIKTLAIMRRPQNVWLWVYMFDDNNRPVAAFCGTDVVDDLDGFARYVKELKRFADGGSPDDLYNENDFPPKVTAPIAEDRVKDVILADGKKYSGWMLSRRPVYASWMRKEILL